MNISEIAKLAEVSVSAVSRYLNNGYVSQEKKDRIAKVIKETGYQPLRSAQTLRTGKTNLIGAIVPKISSESVSRMINGITEVLEDSEYRLLLANTDNKIDKEIEYLNLFRDTTVDGVILIGSVINKKHMDIISEYKKPIIILAQNIPNVSCVYFDDYNASYSATQALINTGCYHIAYIGIDLKDKAAGKSRYEGYYTAIIDNGIKFERNLMYISEPTYESAYSTAKNLFETGKKIDGIFCANDIISVAVLKAMREYHIKSPDDIKIASVGDSKIASFISPSVTSAHLFYKTGGEEACRMILDMIENGTTSNIKRNMIGSKLIERETTGNYKNFKIN